MSRQGYVGGLGHQTDPETGGLIYMQARYYDPSTGRFMSEDPDCNGKNWFIYCGDQPTNQIDGDGKVGSPLIEECYLQIMKAVRGLEAVEIDIPIAEWATVFSKTTTADRFIVSVLEEQATKMMVTGFAYDTTSAELAERGSEDAAVLAGGYGTVCVLTATSLQELAELIMTNTDEVITGI